ncbi:RISC-loading complex subunit TARBP2-like, partial [Athene cunicularia]|uniref:RISC-loading complex subunit TARBP2-like n=1 Tax=Athene cunicularia TaxID=194338 RepID=UPI000EF74EF8
SHLEADPARLGPGSAPFGDGSSFLGRSSPHFRACQWPCPPQTPPFVCVSPPQELVVQKGWRLPEYTVTQESGPAHRKEFTMTCRVERFVEIGSGTSKKLAKRNAAAKMLVRIHNVPMEPREGSEAEVEEDQFSMVLAKLLSLKRDSKSQKPICLHRDSAQTALEKQKRRVLGGGSATQDLNQKCKLPRPEVTLLTPKETEDE